MKKKLTLRQGSILLLTILLILVAGFYAIARDQLNRKISVSKPVATGENVGELLAGNTVEQAFSPEADILRSFSLFFQTYSRTNAGHLEISILDGENSLYTVNVDTSSIQDNSYMTFTPALTDLSDHALTLRITSPDGQPGNAVTVVYGTDTAVGRGSVDLTIDNPILLNGTPLDGQLCMITTTEKTLWFGQYYWYFLAGVLFLCGGYLLWLDRCAKIGRNCLGLRFLAVIHRYRFFSKRYGIACC